MKRIYTARRYGWFIVKDGAIVYGPTENWLAVWWRYLWL